MTIQGLLGSGSFAHSVTLTKTVVNTSSLAAELGIFPWAGGPILIRTGNLLNLSTLKATGNDGPGGSIALEARGGLDIRDSSLVTKADFSPGDSVVKAGTSINLTGTFINTHPGLGGLGSGVIVGSITMAAPVISIEDSELNVSGSSGSACTIGLTGTKAVSLSNGTVLSAEDGGGTIQIDGGARFTSQQSTISTQGGFGNGGTIQVEATRIRLTDTQLTTAISGGPQTAGAVSP